MIDLKKTISSCIQVAIDNALSEGEIRRLLETPKTSEHGDLSFPCFALAKIYKENPNLLAKDLTGKLTHEWIDHVEAVGPYVNIFFNKKAISQLIIQAVLHQGENYGQSGSGKGKTIVLDYSSPNIAKPFSMGHLRSTVIGHSLALIAEKHGYDTVKINHLGDWGTQFGKLITAYKHWGSEALIKKEPIKELLQLYVKFHQKAEEHPHLHEEARAWFRKLELDDAEAKQLWSWFRDESLKEFEKTYQLLGVSFDSNYGEAFYNNQMNAVVDTLQQSDLLSTSDGAEIVPLSDENLPPCLIKKSDGATLYATRDITAAIYRKQTYQFDEALYIVGPEQSIHFQQVKAVLSKMGHSWATHIHHIPFGLYLQEGKKMSTRKGRVILLEEVLQDAIQLASENIEQKNPHLKNKDEVAKAVGVGAIIFHDLKNERMKQIEFSLEDMLTFEGETGPYVQYTQARAQSILHKSQQQTYKIEGLSSEYAWQVAKLLSLYPDKLVLAHEKSAPSIIAKYLISLAQSFNKYYANEKILHKDEHLSSRLGLVKAVTIILTDGLHLLGMKAPQEM